MLLMCGHNTPTYKNNASSPGNGAYCYTPPIHALCLRFMLNAWLCAHYKCLCCFCYYFWPTSTKPQAWILRESNNGCNGCSVGRHGVLKRDRIPLLKSYRLTVEMTGSLTDWNLIININFIHITVSDIIDRIPHSDIILWNKSFQADAVPCLQHNTM